MTIQSSSPCSSAPRRRGSSRRLWRTVVSFSAASVLIRLLGIYVASAIFIGGFMVWKGRYGWIPTLSVSLGVPIALFLMFEVWFLVPLPKGPVENLLGY